MDRVSTAPASPAQRHLYALVSRFRQLSRAYHLAEAYRIRGALDVAALATAVDGVVARHEALRTTMRSGDAGADLVVEPASEGVLRLVDVPSDPPDRLEQAVADECDAPFDLHGGRLARLVLLRLASDDHVLLVVVHHIVFDAWSLELLWHEIGALYNHGVSGVPHGLAPVRLQLTQYTSEHHAWLSTEPAGRMLDYWLTELTGCPDGATVPYDPEAAAVSTHVGARECLALPGEVAAGVLKLASELRISVASVLLAAWQLVVAGSAGASTVVVGVPIANRIRVELLDTMGFLVNVHAVRLDVTAVSLRETLVTAGRKLLGAVIHQEMTMPHVLAAARRDGTRVPARPFRVMFTSQDRPSAPLSLDGLHVERHPMGSTTRTADMTLHLRRDGVGLDCELEYATNRYLARTATSTLARYAEILGHLVRRPDDPACALVNRHGAG